MVTATATGRSCFQCGTTEPGDRFTSLPDENGIARAIHIPVVAIDGKSVDITPGCLKGFEERVAAVRRREIQEHQEDMALRALRREGAPTRLDGMGPKTLAELDRIGSKPRKTERGFDCTATDCKRFFDTEAGRETHRRKAHKGDHNAKR